MSARQLLRAIYDSWRVSSIHHAAIQSDRSGVGELHLGFHCMPIHTRTIYPLSAWFQYPTQKQERSQGLLRLLVRSNSLMQALSHFLPA